MTERARVGRIVAVGGGKGGVGKSVISTNLAVALARMGVRVVMLDADLGAPNLHTMFGIMRPQRTVADFLSGHCTNLEELTTPTAVSGLSVICGAEGALNSANPTFQSKQQLLVELGKLKADVLLIDVGAGVDLNTIDFFNAADTRLVVMVPEVTSLQNGYAFLKMALFRRLQRAVAGMRVSDRLHAAFGKDAFEIGSSMDRLSTFFSMLEDEAPELVTHFRGLLVEFNAQLVGNMLHRPADSNSLFAMKRLIHDRLGLEVEIAAAVRQNANMRNSVNTGKPFASVMSSGDPDMFEITQLATRVLRQDLAPLYRIREGFLRAMHQAPQDDGLDGRFQFGLEGVTAEPEPPAAQVVAEPRPPRPTPSLAFRSEFSQLQRSSTRLKLYLPIELNFDGRWYMAQLTEVNEGGGSITGVRPQASWSGARGKLRVIDDPVATGELAIAMHTIDAANSRIIVTFDDAGQAGKLVAELRERARQQPPAAARVA